MQIMFLTSTADHRHCCSQNVAAARETLLHYEPFRLDSRYNLCCSFFWVWCWDALSPTLWNLLWICFLCRVSLSFRVSKSCPRLLINMEKAGQVSLHPSTNSFLTFLSKLFSFCHRCVSWIVCAASFVSLCRPILCLGCWVLEEGWTLTQTRRTGDTEMLLLLLLCNRFTIFVFLLQLTSEIHIWSESDQIHWIR